MVYERNEWKRDSLSAKAASTIAWVRYFATLYGDKMPDAETVHLPSCLTINNIFATCKDELSANGEEACSESHFYHLWKTALADIKIPAVSSASTVFYCLCGHC